MVKGDDVVKWKYNNLLYMAERKRIYLRLAHLSDEGIKQEHIKEAFETNWVV